MNGTGEDRPVRMVAVWCPDWPVMAAGIPAATPAAVLHASRVVACSPAARDDGVVPGLRRRAAQERCPELALLPCEPERDALAFEPVLAAVEGLTPHVEVAKPGSCAFPARGAARWHGGEERLAELLAGAVGEVLGERGRCLVGVADGRFAAALAATDGAIVPPGRSREFLTSFSVDTLGLPDLADLLHRLGLRTLGDLASLPSATVSARFGTDGVHAHRLASGLDLYPPARHQPPPDLTERAELDPPAERGEAAAFATRLVATQLCERLDRRGLACTRLRIELHTEHGEAHARSWRLDAGGTGGSGGRSLAGGPGAAGAAAIVDRVRWQLEGWLGGARAGAAGDGPPTAGITLVLLVPEEVAPARGRQLGFWGEEAGERERAARAVARVQGLLGAGSVLLARLRGGRDPTDRAAPANLSAAEPAAEPSSQGRAGSGRDRRTPPEGEPLRARPEGEPPWPGQVPPPAPATVYAEPVAAELRGPGGEPVAVSGNGLLDGQPSRIEVAGRPAAAVAAWSAAWPLDERWWDARRHRRVARLQVITEAGDAWLLYLVGGRWWAIARYD